MNWHILRCDEGRGFVSNRIFWVLVDLQMMIFGKVFYEDYGVVKRLLTIDEILNLGYGILWKESIKKQ